MSLARRAPAVLVLTLLLGGCGGASGQPATVVQGGELGGLSFLDASHGWVVGNERTTGTLFIAATVDGGSSWSSVKIENTRRSILTGVAFRDLSRGWAFGTHALAFSTEDGGRTWTADQAVGDVRTFRYRNGSGSLTLGAPGYSKRDGFYTFHDNDVRGGRLRETGSGSFNLFPHDVQIVDAQTLWGFGDGSLYRSVDGGASWTVTRVDEAYQGPSTIGDGVRSVFFFSGTSGFIMVGNRVFGTSDAGVTRRALGTVPLDGLTFSALHFFDDTRGLALVTNRKVGVVFATPDGGVTWSESVDLGLGEWNRLFVLDAAHAWAAGVVKGDVVVRRFRPL